MSMEHCAICSDLMNSASNVVEFPLSFELDAKNQFPLRSHATSVAMEYRIAWEAAELLVVRAVLPLFITSLFVSAIIGISILFILPDNTVEIKVKSESHTS